MKHAFFYLHIHPVTITPVQSREIARLAGLIMTVHGSAPWRDSVPKQLNRVSVSARLRFHDRLNRTPNLEVVRFLHTQSFLRLRVAKSIHWQAVLCDIDIIEITAQRSVVGGCGG